MNRLSLIAPCLVTLALAHPALAWDYTIYEYNSSGALIGSNGYNTSAGDLTYTLTANTRFVDVIPAGSTSDIPYLTFTGGPSSGEVAFYLGADANGTTAPDYATTDSLPSLAGRDLRGIDATGLAGTTISKFYGGIGRDFGYACSPQPCDLTIYSLRFDRLVRFDVGEDMYGDVWVTGASSWSPFVIEAGTIHTQSRITLTDGDITRIETNGSTPDPSGAGDMKGWVTAMNGNIRSIESSGRIAVYSTTANHQGISAPKGHITSMTAAKAISQFEPGAPGSIAGIRANTGIDSIQAKSIDANISARSDLVQAVPAGSGNLGRLVTTDGDVSEDSVVTAMKFTPVNPGDTIEIHGDYAGDLIFRTNSSSDGDIKGGVIILGGVPSGATIKVEGKIIDNATNNGRITIGGSLAGDIDIDGSAGLQGQIVVNANDPPTSPGTWAGKVDIGSTPIRLWASSSSPDTAPYYERLSAALGGGAVGLVPYHLHDTDCVPSNGEWICETWPTLEENDNRQTIILRFYGPVLDGTDDSTPPVIVMAGHVDNPSSEADRTSACDIYVAPAGRPREIRVSPGPGIAGDFGHDQSIQITPRLTGGTRDLRCGETFAATPPQAAGFEYLATPLCPLFMLDLDASGTVDVDDVSAWGASPRDINRSGAADSEDLMLIVGAIE